MIQDYVTLIAAVAAAVVSIITALRGQKTEEKVAALAAAVAPRPPVFVPAPAPPGGNSVAEVERWLSFFRSLFGGSPPGAGEPPAFSFGDIFKYYGAFEELSAFLGSLKGEPVGLVGYSPVLKTRVDGRHAEIGPVPIVFRD